jgi:hypothetical protein
MSRSFESGRQDLNLRPPGPQPERPGVPEGIRLSRAGSSCSELRAVVVNLDPGLDPEPGEQLPARPVGPLR